MQGAQSGQYVIDNMATRCLSGHSPSNEVCCLQRIDRLQAEQKSLDLLKESHLLAPFDVIAG